MSGGFWDKLRYDHLQTLIGYGGEQAPNEVEFATLLTDILVILLDGGAPDLLYHVVRDNELVALPKGEDDIRPVGMGMVVRKLASIVILAHTFEPPTAASEDQLSESFNDVAFKGLQYGCTALLGRLWFFVLKEKREN